MTLDPDSLIHGYLDDLLDEDQLRALSERIKSDPDVARAFASAWLQHDRLRDRFHLLDVLGETTPAEPVPGRAWRRRGAVLALAAVVLIVGLILFPSMPQPRVDAAEAQLDRLIAAASSAGDRTYRIIALQPALSPPDGRPRPPIDGALLHVRGQGQYVLIRLPGSAEAFITGSNGREAWSIAPEGPVRVSSDPSRFRGAVPGEQQDLPFLDLETALGRLREAYELELPEPEPGENGRRLLARKRSPRYRGPRDVAVLFDEPTGTIRRLELYGLPQAQGGPRALALELIGQEDLGPDFFEHGHHHDAERRVIRESP